MEEIEIVGVQSVDFVDDQGVQVTGTNYFYTQLKDSVDGVATGKIFVTNKRAAQLRYVPQLGDLVRVYYNRYGKPGDFELVQGK